MPNIRTITLPCVCLIAAATSMLAQDAPTLKKGNVEIGLFTGAGYGLGFTGSTNGASYSNAATNFHVMGGGDFGYALTKSIFLVGEASYFPSISPAVSSSTPSCPPNVTAPGTDSQPCYRTDLTYDRRVFEFNGGVHLRLPMPESRVVPYLAFGLGAAHFLEAPITKTSVQLAGCSGTGCLTAGTSNLKAPGATGAEVAAGAGLRVYVTEHFGFRGEFRLYHPFGLENVGNFYRATGGIFFQLK